MPMIRFYVYKTKDQATNLKFLLYLYESMSGLKINLNKSEAIMVSHDMNKAAEYVDAFNFDIGNCPIKYLGVQCQDRNFILLTGFP